MRQPTFFIPHGGGPCFFMEWSMGPADTWERLAAWLKGFNQRLPEPPKALLVVSGHWEQQRPTVMTAERPPMLYDYFGFPPHTYQLQWPAPGAPELAEKVRSLLGDRGIAVESDEERGFDHGVFVPLLLCYPEADVPTLQLSLLSSLDPESHLAVGRALEPLRDEGVVIIGSGNSYHNMRGYMTPAALDHSHRFDGWLAEIVALPRKEREVALVRWHEAPSAKECHPREEHLLPLMVAAGAAGNSAGSIAFQDVMMGVSTSAVQFG